MAYLSFNATGLGVPVLTPTLDKFMPGLGTVAPWNKSGMFEHRQPFRPTTTLTGLSTLLTPVPATAHMAIGELATSGNYKTFHTRGSRGLTSPPTK